MTNKEKKCSRCKKIKPLDNFHKDKSKSLGLSSHCKECQFEYLKIWRTKNPKKQKEHASLYNKRHRETINKKLKVWQKNNRKKTNDYFVKWGKKNPVKLEMKNLRRRAKKLEINLSFDEYKQILKKQNGVCAVCGKKEITKHRVSNTCYILSIDHCHKTKKIRGLLCKKCNSGLGFFNDNPKLVLKAYSYLIKNL